MKYITIPKELKQESLIQVIDNGMKPYRPRLLYYNIESASKSWSRRLERCQDLILERINFSDEIGGIEGKTAKYDSLTWALKKILEEHGDILKEYPDVPTGKILSSPAFDFGDADYYRLGDLMNFIQQKTSEEDESYWSEQTDEGYTRGVLVLYLLLFLLHIELIDLYDLLDSVKHKPKEPVTSIEEILRDCATKGKEKQEPHFNVDLPDEVLIAILNGLKQVKWKNNRVMDIGLVGDDITEEEWLYILKGVTRGCFTMTRKLPWKSVQACKSFVEQLLGKNYQLAEEIFCWLDKKGMHEIKNLRLIKNDRRDDICDEKTGIIAVIIQNAMRLMDKKTA